MREDRALELAQPLPRLDAEPVDELAPGVAVGLERIRLAVAAVQRQHQLATQVLPIGVIGDQRREPADDVGVAAAGEIGLDLLLERGDAELVAGA